MYIELFHLVYTCNVAFAFPHQYRKHQKLLSNICTCIPYISHEYQQHQYVVQCATYSCECIVMHKMYIGFLNSEINRKCKRKRNKCESVQLSDWTGPTNDFICSIVKSFSLKVYEMDKANVEHWIQATQCLWPTIKEIVSLVSNNGNCLNNWSTKCSIDFDFRHLLWLKIDFFYAILTNRLEMHFNKKCIIEARIEVTN